MSDLLAAIAARTQAAAQPRAERYADANRLFTVRIVRPATEPTFNRAAGAFVPKTQPVVFEGPARIRPVTPAQQVDLGDGPSYWSELQVIIGLGAALEPRVDDIVTITSTPPPGDSAVTGKIYRVSGVGEGGHMATGFTLSCSGVSPSRQTRPAP